VNKAGYRNFGLTGDTAQAGTGEGAAPDPERTTFIGRCGMSETRFLTRWAIAITVAGLITGGAVGVTAQQKSGDQPQPAEMFTAGCKCTISGDGTGSYDCHTPSACGPGVWNCLVQCGDVIF
jgi:hypothetical protein